MEDIRTAEAIDRNGGDPLATYSRATIEEALPDRPWLDIDQAAAYLRTSRRTVYKLCALSKLAYHVRVGVRWFTKDDLDDYIASGRVDIYGGARRRRKTA